MKRILHLLQITLATLCFVFTIATVKAQPLLVENFDYEAGALLTAYGWTAHSVGGTQAIDVVVPGLTFDGYPLSNIGGLLWWITTGKMFTVNSRFRLLEKSMLPLWFR